MRDTVEATRTEMRSEKDYAVYKREGHIARGQYRRAACYNVLVNVIENELLANLPEPKDPVERVARALWEEYETGRYMGRVFEDHWPEDRPLYMEKARALLEGS